MITLKSWLKAARLRTLPLSLSGIILGSFLAHSDGSFNIVTFVLAVFTTIGFQVISNFANDYGDGVKGIDNEDRIGPKRTIQSGEITPVSMLFAIKSTGVLTLGIAFLLIFVSFGKENIIYSISFIVLGIAAILAAIKYTMGEKPYGYSGFGDVFVFIFFGIVSVCGSYFLITQTLDITIFLPAFSVGSLSVGVLNLNNLRDRESDKKSGKNTIVVKIGVEFGKYYHYYLIVSSFLFSFLFTMIHYSSPWQFLFLFAFLPIFKHLLRVYRNENPKDLDPELKKLALSTFLFAILFGLGQIM